MLFTPGLGWRVWTESGWGGVERSEQVLRSVVMDLPDVHRAEASALPRRGQDTEKKNALKWATRSEQRATSTILGELESEERVLVPSVSDWDAEGFIAGLPVTAGIGRLVDLRTGEIVLDARTRRVSRSLGAAYDDSPGGDLKLLWETAALGGPGRWFYKYVRDLEGQMGAENIRLLQRAAGASLYGRRGVSGDTDAVFVLKGPARSGKSTFAECLLKIAGQYGKAQNHNLLFGDKGNPEFTDAAIFGYRVMTLSEPPMSAPLNTTKLKQLSGGDSITGRLPYGREEISLHPGVLAVADDQPRAGGRRRGGLAADEVLPVRALLGRRLDLGSSSEVQVGEPVAAIGSPFGEQSSLSVGVVSAKDRTIEALTDFSISDAIQTDAAINRGNSGGPLLDARRPRDRHQLADPLVRRRQRGRRLRGLGRHRAALDRADPRRRQGRLRLHRDQLAAALSAARRQARRAGRRGRAGRRRRQGRPGRQGRASRAATRRSASRPRW